MSSEPNTPPLKIVTVSGSPSASSRSTWLLRHAEERLAAHRVKIDRVDPRLLPASELLAGHADALAVRDAVGRLLVADVVVVATPIYKAAYSGLLKVFLDLLPPDALRGKPVLALATGGSPAHLLAIDYALKPVLGALGARHLPDAVYVCEHQLVPAGHGGFLPAPEVTERLQRALDDTLSAAIAHPPVRRRASASAAAVAPC